MLIAIQSWLNETPAQVASGKQPAYFTLGMSFMALCFVRFPLAPRAREGRVFADCGGLVDLSSLVLSGNGQKPHGSYDRGTSRSDTSVGRGRKGEWNEIGVIHVVAHSLVVFAYVGLDIDRLSRGVSTVSCEGWNVSRTPDPLSHLTRAPRVKKKSVLNRLEPHHTTLTPLHRLSKPLRSFHAS